MIEGIELLYQRIAESIEDAIGEEWTVARIDAIFYPETSDYIGEYERKADGKRRGFSTTSDCERAVREIRRKFRDAGQRLWGQLQFELQSDGKFNIKWGYDNCDEQGNTIFDEEAYLKANEERRSRLSQ